MLQWLEICGNTGAFFTRFALVPCYRLPGGGLVLIDSGSEAHPELPETLERHGGPVRAVICTHLHPDHIANNRLLIDRYGAEIWADAAEIAAVGARYDALRSDPLEQKWLCTEPDYPVRPFPEGGALTVDGAVFSLVPTPGHTEGHTAVVTPDGVCCVGDAVLTGEVLAASKLPYMEYDVDLAAASMAELGQGRWPWYAAAHMAAVPQSEWKALTDANIRKELTLNALLRRLFDRPVPFEEAVTAFMRAAGARREEPLRRVSQRTSAATRFYALEKAGELRIADGMVYPVRTGN